MSVNKVVARKHIGDRKKTSMFLYLSEGSRCSKITLELIMNMFEKIIFTIFRCLSDTTGLAKIELRDGIGWFGMGKYRVGPEIMEHPPLH